MDKFEITKAGIIQAAKVCPDAQRVMKELFPEAFKEKWVDCTKECELRLHYVAGFNGYDIKVYLDKLEIATMYPNGYIARIGPGYRITKSEGSQKDSIFIIERKETPNE